jgi:hypothetical protein
MTIDQDWLIALDHHVIGKKERQFRSGWCRACPEGDERKTEKDPAAHGWSGAEGVV